MFTVDAPSTIVGDVAGASQNRVGDGSNVFVIAGVLHFQWPTTYVMIVPPFIPRPWAMVYVSGAAEIVGGFGLLLPSVRRLAAWGLVALLIAVFPANIFMALDHVQVTAKPLPHWELWARLPLQFPLIWWTLWCSKTGSRE
jgi:uncharacterized membrane protein